MYFTWRNSVQYRENEKEMLVCREKTQYCCHNLSILSHKNGENICLKK